MFSKVENGNFNGFEALMLVYDDNFTNETGIDEMVYLNTEVNYKSIYSDGTIDSLLEKAEPLKIGESAIIETEFGVHIIMRYEPEAGAYSNAKYEFYFKSFVTNLVNELFFDRIEPYTANITINEKFKKEVDISTITPNYNFY